MRTSSQPLGALTDHVSQVAISADGQSLGVIAGLDRRMAFARADLTGQARPILSDGASGDKASTSSAGSPPVGSDRPVRTCRSPGSSTPSPFGREVVVQETFGLRSTATSVTTRGSRSNRMPRSPVARWKIHLRPSLNTEPAELAIDIADPDTWTALDDALHS